ncbi:MAG: MoxR family ATPase [Bacteroides sp.]|nr:MoxR family ATPase [Eubacterium sp.]MCM1418090.1 MoxR family ATPase [Roseburia sp.]MCM1462234.1 MoxR family ATPase [Bacteroides sp.]
MNEKVKLLTDNIEKVIIGKRKVIIKLIAALLSGGHVLIEDVPGVGKTKLVTALSASVNGECRRIQFTPDLMPSDITGFTMINRSTGENEYRSGAAMCNFLLADEINRASPKAQSALLEIMEELQVSVDGVTYPLPKPFMAMATQNPVETYGTYHLPEAQMDRFLMKLSIGYPSPEEETAILDQKEKEREALDAVITLDDLLALREKTETIEVHDSVKRYIVDLVNATRASEFTALGASPRGSIGLFRAARAAALIDGRDYAVPDDVKRIASEVLSHRLILSPKGKSVHGSAESVMKAILAETPIPPAV